MNITLVAIPTSLIVLAVAVLLWRQAERATSRWVKFELYILSAGMIGFVGLGWAAGLWMQ